MSEAPTDTLFRLLDGEVIALFPAIPYNNNTGLCMSYQRVGQHGAASVSLATELKAASKAEYGPLKAELESMGYVIRVRRVVNRAMNYARVTTIILANSTLRRGVKAPTLRGNAEA